MPKKNKSSNSGFYVFMQKLRQSMTHEGQSGKPDMQAMLALADSKWRTLSNEERQHYNQLAKSQKRMKNFKMDMDGHDNQGNVLANFTDSYAENAKRRQENREYDYSLWPPVEDIVKKVFYFVSFQVLCEIEEDESWVPCEVGLVEWSMSDGITNTYHKFIDPGPIPVGYRFACQSHSDDTHKIPIEGFQLAVDDYESIYRDIELFINPDRLAGQYPPMYTLHAGNGKPWRCTESCMQWIYKNAKLREPDHLHKIYCLEDVVTGLYRLAGENISESSAIKLLTTTTWDYERDTRCPYHEEHDVKDCALAQCRRFAFALSDALKNVYDFELTEKHFPALNQSTLSYTILSPSEISRRVGQKTFPKAKYRSEGVSSSRQEGTRITGNYGGIGRGLTAAPWSSHSEPVAQPDTGGQSSSFMLDKGQTSSWSSAAHHSTWQKPLPKTETTCRQPTMMPAAGRGFQLKAAGEPVEKAEISQAPVPSANHLYSNPGQKSDPEHGQPKPVGVINNDVPVNPPGIGRARGRAIQPRLASGGPGMTAPPSASRLPNGVGRGFLK